MKLGVPELCPEGQPGSVGGQEGALGTRESASDTSRCSVGSWNPRLEEQQGPVKASKRRAHGLSSGWRGATQPLGSSTSSCGHQRTPPWACRLLWCRGTLHSANRPHSGPPFPLYPGPEKARWRTDMGHWHSEAAHLSWKGPKFAYCFRS